MKVLPKKKFTINTISDDNLNGILNNTSFEILNGDDFNWNGKKDNILEQLLNHEYATSIISWYKTAFNKETNDEETLYDVISQETTNINGVEFNKYTLKVYNDIY